MPARWSEAEARRFLRTTPVARAPRIPPAAGFPCTERVFLVLPYPPLNNRYYRHVNNRVVLSAAGRAYRRVVADVVLTEWPRHLARPLNTQVDVWMTLYPPSARHRPDADAPLKAPLDAMQYAGVYLNDALVTDVHLLKRAPRPPWGCLEVTILPHEE